MTLRTQSSISTLSFSVPSQSRSDWQFHVANNSINVVDIGNRGRKQTSIDREDRMTVCSVDDLSVLVWVKWFYLEKERAALTFYEI